MDAFKRGEALILFLGDFCFLLLSLWLTLFIRYGDELLWNAFLIHLVPFSILYVVWVLVFFIAGMYERHTAIFRNELPAIILRALVANNIIAVLFFYFIPYFGITPKTNLFIYLFLSFIFILSWRLYGYTLFGVRRKQNAILIASGEEMKELKNEVNANPYINLKFISSVDLLDVSAIDFQTEVLERIFTEDATMVVVDFKNEKINNLLPHLYKLLFSNIAFVDMHTLYEEIFNRIPLSLITYSWVLENISLFPKVTYDFLKRVMDLSISFFVAIISLLIYPFVYIGIKLDDGGPIFIKQERVGKNSKIIHMVKFRTMTVNHTDLLSRNEENQITRVGYILRKYRIDELPQLWNVFRGDISLIGPRPELPSGVHQYEKEIPYYGVRHLIKPGLSGWAQIYQKNHPHHGLEVSKTKEKLSYDLYYLKNRSFLLDIKIALKTIKTLLSRSGI